MSKQSVKGGPDSVAQGFRAEAERESMTEAQAFQPDPRRHWTKRRNMPGALRLRQRDVFLRS